jgi:hypothetical protein
MVLRAFSSGGETGLITPVLEGRTEVRRAVLRIEEAPEDLGYRPQRKW